MPQLFVFQTYFAEISYTHYEKYEMTYLPTTHAPIQRTSILLDIEL